ncbi:terpene synthase [Chryseobacterium pennae]|uniref:Terpene synthase n=1 Tax=Chryseobacterium pennae TaxID=2258962 RepID=A0A3D9CBS3_9FLAO|nr:terpene synthase [Chryseobacterium pennae]REC63066.1 terpene synthase [Chryseobacterium pennae]
MNTQMLSRFQYPFPMLKNPYAEQLQDITDNQWIDDEYLYLYKDDPDTRYKYKKTKTAHIASQWFPTASLERLRPVCRFMLWTLYNDDMYEEGTPLEIKHVHRQSIAVLKGELIAEKADIPLAPLLASLREELLQFIPDESLQRFISALDKYFKGLEQELAYKEKKAFPTVEECIAIREDSLCLFPFLELMDLETKLPLPADIYNHPVIQRLKALASRMMVYYNEVQSVRKDEATGSIYYNVVKTIQHNRNISLEEACLEDLRIHDEDLKEFIHLQRSLPDFGEWHDAVVNRIHYISMTLSGWKNISARMERYNTLEGFPSVETVKKAGH